MNTNVKTNKWGILAVVFIISKIAIVVTNSKLPIFQIKAWEVRRLSKILIGFVHQFLRVI